MTGLELVGVGAITFVVGFVTTWVILWLAGGDW
jgi:hypothetical protein